MPRKSADLDIRLTGRNGWQAILPPPRLGRQGERGGILFPLSQCAAHCRWSRSRTASIHHAGSDATSGRSRRRWTILRGLSSDLTGGRRGIARPNASRFSCPLTPRGTLWSCKVAMHQKSHRALSSWVGEPARTTLVVELERARDSVDQVFFIRNSRLSFRPMSTTQVHRLVRQSAATLQNRGCTTSVYGTQSQERTFGEATRTTCRVRFELIARRR